jgi:general secretion pathway protein G
LTKAVHGHALAPGRHRSRQGVRRRSYRGFTLMELVVTLGLIGLLALLAAPLAELEIQREREAQLRQSLREIRDALDGYKRAAEKGFIQRKVGDSGFPPSLRVLVEGVTNQRSPNNQKMYFLRRVPRDPFAAPELAAEETWELRSYSSDPGSPSSGEDVYDVHSRAAGTGLNGIPYQRW